MRKKFERIETLTMLVMLADEAGNVLLRNFILLTLLNIKNARLYLALSIAMMIFRMKMVQDIVSDKFVAYEAEAQWISDRVIDPIIGKINEVKTK